MVRWSQVASAAMILLLVVAVSQAQSAAKMPAADLVKAVISKELNSSAAPDVRWKYVLYKDADGKQETREVVQTKSGSIDRLLAVGGKPLSSTQEREEADRIVKLSHHPDEQRKMEQAHRKDAEQCTVFLQMIPQTFLFDYAGESGNLTKVTFRPNPGFQPPSREAKVLHAMMGEMWIDARQQRLVSIWGKLIDDVKFGGGLLGHLEKGGQFVVKRAEMSPGHWEMTDLSVNMQGKALLFKSIAVQQRELHRNFESVPEDLNLSDAARILLKESLIAQR